MPERGASTDTLRSSGIVCPAVTTVASATASQVPRSTVRRVGPTNYRRDVVDRLAQSATDDRQLHPDVHEHRARRDVGHRVMTGGEEELERIPLRDVQQPGRQLKQHRADQHQDRQPFDLADQPANDRRSNSFGHTDHSLTTISGIAAMPEMTCRPWVTRYSQTGRVGQKNQGCGCWMK